MNNKNSRIRAHARHLLDDNIFGKDWVKGALFYMLFAAIIGGIGALLGTVAGLGVSFVLETPLNSVVLNAAIVFLSVFIPLVVVYALIGPVNVGISAVYLDLVRRGDNIKFKKFFYGFRHFLSNAILGIMYIVQVTLWTLIFIIPGIYVAYSYALVFHVKRDHPEFTWKQCFDESERLMEGNRWKLFKLQFAHLGWFIVGLAFVVVGAFWAEPYLHTSTAIFYEDVKASK